MGIGPSRLGQKRAKCRGPLPIAASLGARLSRAAHASRRKTQQNAQQRVDNFLFDKKK
jgi:hypothetical protein